MEFKITSSFKNPSEHNEKIMREHLKDHKYKTELCKNYSKLGKCSYKSKCRYAHREDELVSKNISNKNYKKTKCDKFHNSPGYCPYGVRCQYIHNDMNFSNMSLFEFNYYQMLLITKYYNPSNLEKTNNSLINYEEVQNNLPINSFQSSSYFYLSNRSSNELSRENQNIPKSSRLTVFKEVTKRKEKKLINHSKFSYESQDRSVKKDQNFQRVFQEKLNGFCNIYKNPNEFLFNDISGQFSKSNNNDIEISNTFRKGSEETYCNQFCNSSVSEGFSDNQTRCNSKADSLKNNDLY